MRIGKQKVVLISWLLILAALLIGVFLTGSLDGGETESVQVAMKDAVLHDVNQISLFGIKDVNPD